MISGRRTWLVILTVLACERATAPDSSRPAPARETPAPDEAPAKAIKRSSDGHCDPMPKVDTPCNDGDSYCVESWGTPGGHSSALWCRGGKWEREEERNLPADEAGGE